MRIHPNMRFRRLFLHHELDELVVCGMSAWYWMLRNRSPTVNATITVLVSLPDHLVDLVVSELLADGGHDVTQLSSGDEAVVVAVKDLECFPNLLLRVGVLHLAGHHGEEFYAGVSPASLIDVI